MRTIRRSILSGSWYPGDAGRLKSDISHFESKSKNTLVDMNQLLGFIVPHAGYFYSGKAAVAAYKLLQKREYKTVIILAPSHSSYFNGVSCSSYGFYETPLGKVEVNNALADSLKGSSSLFIYNETAENYEHSAEIHLPFLQYYLRDFQILPLLIGNVSKKEIPEIAESIINIMDKDTLVVASSDFTHYGYRFGYTPFDKCGNTDIIREKISKLDNDHIDFIIKFDYPGFLKLKEETGATICGYMPISIITALFVKGNTHASLADYYMSGDITGEYDQTVSYATIIFYK